MYVIGPSLTENSQMERYSSATKNAWRRSMNSSSERIVTIVCRSEKPWRSILQAGQPCSSINGVGAEPHLVHFVKRDRVVKDHISRNSFHEHLMRLPALDHDHVRMNQNESRPGLNVNIMRQSGAVRRVFKDLGVARSGCRDQLLAGLPNCEHGQPIAFLLRQVSTKFIIAIDD